jgi:hypothetical protein
MFGSRTDRDYYLAMADKCEQSAEGSVDPHVREEWMKLRAQWVALAEGDG